MPVDKYILSGIEFESIPEKLDSQINITCRHQLYCYVIFTQNDYLELPTSTTFNNLTINLQNDNESNLLIKEFPSPRVKSNQFLVRLYFKYL